MSGHRPWREVRDERLSAMTPEERATALAARERAREELQGELDAEATCGHCGRPITTAARGWAADKTTLCHTGTVPADGDPPDCYRLCTTRGHATDGLCCRTDWRPTVEELHELNLMPDVRVDVWTAWPLPAEARATHAPTGLTGTGIGIMAGLRARAVLARKLAARQGPPDA